MLSISFLFLISLVVIIPVAIIVIVAVVQDARRERNEGSTKRQEGKE